MQCACGCRLAAASRLHAAWCARARAAQAGPPMHARCVCARTQELGLEELREVARVQPTRRASGAGEGEGWCSCLGAWVCVGCAAHAAGLRRAWGHELMVALMHALRGTQAQALPPPTLMRTLRPSAGRQRQQRGVAQWGRCSQRPPRPPPPQPPWPAAAATAAAVGPAKAGSVKGGPCPTAGAAAAVAVA